MNRKFAGLLLASAAIAVSQGAWAAEAEVNPEIVVTGQKRTENLQKVSVAATVLNGESLASRGVSRLDDIQTASPSLSITTAGLTQSVNIRGVGLASGSANVSNGVATYYDGVFQPPVVTTNSFYDIRAVEVFRGPQGTFVGSNSTGGAIFINSNDPNFNGTSGFVLGEVANFSGFKAQGAVNLPVTDTLAVRVAGNFRKRDSFYSQLNSTINVPGKLDEHGVRVGINWKPTSNFSWLVKGETDAKKTGGYAYRPLLLSRYGVYRSNDPFVLSYSNPTANDEYATQVTSKLEYQTDAGLTLRAVSGYQSKRIWNFYDGDGVSPPSTYAAGTTAPPPNTYSSQGVRERVITQEINLLSPTGEDITWVLGGYYQRNRINVHNDSYTINPSTAGAVLPTSYNDTFAQNRKLTKGVFANTTINLNEQFSVDVGGRFSWYDVKGWGQLTVQAPVPALYAMVFPNGGDYNKISGGTVIRTLADLSGHESDKHFTGKIALNWKPSADHLIYAFAAKGYKSGGVQSPTANFKPETVNDYEIGWKGTLAGGRVTTQLGAFYYDYANFQMDAINTSSGASTPINLSNATIKGVEGQVQSRFGDLRLTGGFGYVDSSLSAATAVDARGYAFYRPGSTFPQCAVGQTAGCSDFSGVNGGPNFMITTAGGPNLYSPKWTWNLSADYEIEAGDFTVTPHVTLSHVGSRWAYFAYNPSRDLMPAYTLLNASVSVETGRYTFDVYATNLTDKLYISGQATNGTNEYYGNPREFGIRARVNF